MTYLIDTNGWIAFLEDSPRLSEKVATLIESGEHDCLVSIASIWEASIKVGLGKLKLPYDLRQDLPGLFEQNGFDVLPVGIDDATAVRDLETIHSDPFDRIQVVQARARGLHVISRDAVFDAYGIRRIW